MQMVKMILLEILKNTLRLETALACELRSFEVTLELGLWYNFPCRLKLCCKSRKLGDKNHMSGSKYSIYNISLYS